MVMRMLGMLLTCKFSDALKEIESRERLFCCESDELPQLLELKNVFISRNSILVPYMYGFSIV